MDRERVLRTLTFWLRPEFLLRVVNRFQKVAGFDRSIALASGALTAMIPLTIVAERPVDAARGKGTADRIIDRYDLTGGGAEAVRDILSPPIGTSTSIGIIGLLFLLVAVLSFSRGVQRLFEQTWELSPLSVRNTFNGLLWIGGFSLYIALSGLVHSAARGQPPRARRGAALHAAVGGVPRLERLGAERQADRAPRRSSRSPSSERCCSRVYSVGAAVYVPHLFSTYATRYGVIGAVFAMISALFCMHGRPRRLSGGGPRDPR